VVRQCERAGLICGDRLFLDCTLVAAHADLDRVGSRELLRQLSAVGEHVAELWEANPEAVPVTGSDQPASASASASSTVGEREETSAAETVAEPADVPGERATLHPVGPDDPPNAALGLLNDRLVSRTDPDATVVQRAKVPADLYYKVHVGIDGGAARIITAVTATTGVVGDEQLLPRLVADHEGNTHRRVLAVAADTKYGTVDNYRWLEERAVRAAIPFSDGNGDNRAIPRSAFCYDEATDTYRCPNGATLRRCGRTTTTAAHPLIIYRPRPADCAACPLRRDVAGPPRSAPCRGRTTTACGTAPSPTCAPGRPVASSASEKLGSRRSSATARSGAASAERAAAASTPSGSRPS
jgi:hypothetical protein